MTDVKRLNINEKDVKRLKIGEWRNDRRQVKNQVQFDAGNSRKSDRRQMREV